MRGNQRGQQTHLVVDQSLDGGVDDRLLHGVPESPLPADGGAARAILRRAVCVCAAVRHEDGLVRIALAVEEARAQARAVGAGSALRLDADPRLNHRTAHRVDHESEGRGRDARRNEEVVQEGRKVEAGLRRLPEPRLPVAAGTRRHEVERRAPLGPHVLALARHPALVAAPAGRVRGLDPIAAHVCAAVGHAPHSHVLKLAVEHARVNLVLQERAPHAQLRMYCGKIGARAEGASKGKCVCVSRAAHAVAAAPAHLVIALSPPEGRNDWATNESRRLRRPVFAVSAPPAQRPDPPCRLLAARRRDPHAQKGALAWALLCPEQTQQSPKVAFVRQMLVTPPAHDGHDTVIVKLPPCSKASGSTSFHVKSAMAAKAKLLL